MAVSSLVAPSAASKTMYRTTLTSGTSYTVPAGVTYLNVTLVGGGGGGGGSSEFTGGAKGDGGNVISQVLSTTPGASISYTIGAGGTAGDPNNQRGGTGGTTSMTGIAATASGGIGGTCGLFRAGGNSLATGMTAENGGQPAMSANANNRNGGVGGTGAIYIEYWV
jgi:hypothetical protein